ncbi:transcriptional repressor [Candidatus Gracilibacteria bacterium]|nr:transcriptional repressor [Candidatus Gracilibacteria bacterium]
MESRITQSRRRFVSVLGERPQITFSELKKELIDTKEMNLATLYRIVDAFKEKGLLHEMTIANERVIFPCQCSDPKENDTITHSFCHNCGTILDTHTRSQAHIVSSITTIQTKNCTRCFK